MGIVREDDEFCGRIGVSYKPNKFLTLGANYRYLDNSSNVKSASYMQHLVDISVSVKY
jgi:opacity protein-like surface antigen